MKKYTTPKITSTSEFEPYDPENKKYSILPSVGAITGAVRMLARSAAKSRMSGPSLPILQQKYDPKAI